MFNINGFEFVFIIVFGFLIFGPDKLPEIAKTVGKAINKFRGAQEEMNKVIKTEVYNPNSDEPFGNPIEALSKSAKAAKKPQDEKPSPKKEDAKKGTGSFAERKAKYDKEQAEKTAEDKKEAE